jgi:NCS1 family nucleobase:cation symporter-1
VASLVVAGVFSVASVILPSPLKQLGMPDMTWISNFSWFLGAAIGYVAFVFLERRHPRMPHLEAGQAGVSDGAADEGVL